MKKEDAYLIGKTAKTHGLKGELSVSFEMFNPEEYILSDVIFLDIDGALVPHFIENYRSHQDKGFIKFEEVDSVEAAKSLMQKEMFVSQEDLPELEEGEFYYHEIIDFEVSDKELGVLGDVTDVYDFKNHAVMEVNYQGKDILIPMHEHIMVETDFDEKKIVVELPDGLLDIYMEEEKGERAKED